MAPALGLAPALGPAPAPGPCALLAWPLPHLLAVLGIPSLPSGTRFRWALALWDKRGTSPGLTCGAGHRPPSRSGERGTTSAPASAPSAASCSVPLLPVPTRPPAYLLVHHLHGGPDGRGYPAFGAAAQGWLWVGPLLIRWTEPELFEHKRTLQERCLRLGHLRILGLVDVLLPAGPQVQGHGKDKIYLHAQVCQIFC
jgi:hypothetical protein